MEGEEEVGGGEEEGEDEVVGERWGILGEGGRNEYCVFRKQRRDLPLLEKRLLPLPLAMHAMTRRRNPVAEKRSSDSILSSWLRSRFSHKLPSCICTRTP